jgi:hypothetical protein
MSVARIRKHANWSWWIKHIAGLAGVACAASVSMLVSTPLQSSKDEVLVSVTSK